jgi:hypothetical protein
MRIGVTLVGVGIVLACLIGGATWVVLAPTSETAPADVDVDVDAETATSKDAEERRQRASDTRSVSRSRRHVTAATKPRDRRPRAAIVLDEIKTLMELSRIDALKQIDALMKAEPVLAESPELAALRVELERSIVRSIAALARDLDPTGASEAKRLLPLISDPDTALWLSRLMRAPDDSGVSRLSGAEMRTVAGAESGDDADALRRHLLRFGQASGAAGATGTAATLTDARLASVRQRFRRTRKRVRPLPIDDEAVREKRRLEQLDKLRERESVGLLDHIHSGLAWLALHQAEDGSFSDPVAKKRCEELGHATSCVAEKSRTTNQLASTALATLAFLDFRDQDALGHFEPTLSRAVAWLKEQVDEQGSFGRSGYGYAGGIALMALGQAATSSADPELATVLERAWNHQVGAAGPRGGYRYRPNQVGDLSVTGWYVQAFEAARDAKIRAALAASPRLDAFTTSVWIEGHKFAYMSADYRSTLESVGMLSLLILRKDLDETLLESWKERLATVRSNKRLNLYTLYYDVRVELALTGALTPERRKTVFEFAEWYQQPDGDAAGRFAAEIDQKRLAATAKDLRPTVSGKDRWFSRASATAVTAFSILTLEHALYRR